MIAAGMAVKQLRGPDTKVVFIGSCISRIGERRSHQFKGIVDYVLTYHDILAALTNKGIDRESQEPSEFDGPQAGLGRILSISGGMSKCVGFDCDLLSLNHVIVAGRERPIRALRQLEEGSIRSRFLDLLFCHGCIDGPIVDKNISGPSRKQIVIDYVKSKFDEDSAEDSEDRKELESLNLRRSFEAQDIFLPEPEEKEIQAVLKIMKKTAPKQNLDCGSCGYNSCREKATAVVQGLAEMEMCMDYLLTQSRSLYAKLDKSHEELKTSHRELENAQRQLIQTEKMASLGQLAAGVAHELNNPMGTIMLFGEMLRKDLKHNDKWSEDIDLILKEAERASKIVKDLLSFSRETKLKPGLININDILEEALSLLQKRKLFSEIQVDKQLSLSLPATFADPDLLKQVFLNIILNGAQAMEGRGVLTVRTFPRKSGKEIEIQIEDTGKGIEKEYIARLFEPFFTTKEKGTGLGLAIVYNIISKHKGKVNVESQLGSGTTFFIDFPVLDQAEWMTGDTSSVSWNPMDGRHNVKAERKDLIG